MSIDLSVGLSVFLSVTYWFDNPYGAQIGLSAFFQYFFQIDGARSTCTAAQKDDVDGENDNKNNKN